MPTYSCKTKDCEGTLTFPDKAASRDNSTRVDPHKARDILLIVIKDEPVECPKCGVSYYERQVK